ncbi:MAG TPA: alpha/beta fold hydrolase [Chloroflexia bacterium]|nr:alpha/beta fold hydrolase [Chloroflexia bacterium]
MDILSTANSDLIPVLAPSENSEIFQEKHTILTNDGLKLHMHGWRGSAEPDKVMVIVHGLGGHGAYYHTSVAPYITPNRTALYAPDLRGHGLSEGKRGDIETFQHFQTDITAAVRWARERHPGLPLFLMGESMGTSIAITYAATASTEAQPDYLILVACVVAPTVSPHPEEILRTIYYLARDRRRCAIPITGREEQGIRDLEFIKVLKSDALFNRKVSVRFLSNMTMHMQKAARLHSHLTMPVFFAQGGRDITVNHRRTRAFFQRITASDKELHYFPEAYHALLNDPDSPLVRQRLLDWMERQSNQSKKR